jgi:hypothetical protein
MKHLFSMTALALSLLTAGNQASLVMAQQKTESPAKGAQTPAPKAETPAQRTDTPAAVPAANPADVASMDAIIAALYDVISGPAAAWVRAS